MLDYLPKYYEELRESKNIITVEAAEFEGLNADIKDVLDQFFVDTATWGLSEWERIAGITYDTGRSDSSRRDYIKAKLRGLGPATPGLIKETADTFYLTEIESEDFANYEVTLRITPTRGIPRNVNDMESAILEIIPAHLNLIIRFSYTPFKEYHDAITTWGDMVAYTWRDITSSFPEAPEYNWDSFELLTWDDVDSKTWEQVDTSLIIK